MATTFNDTTADHKWSTAGNWSDGKPDYSDAVTIGAAVTSLIIDETAYCLSFDATGTAGITVSGGNVLYVYGNFTLDANVTWNHGANIAFMDSCTITTPVSLGSAGLYLAAATGKTVQLGNSLTTTGNITLSNFTTVTFQTNNYDVSCGNFTGSSGTATITLNLGTSTLTCTHFSLDGTLSVTAASSTINISSDSATALNFGGKAWGIVNWKSNASAARAHAITFGSGASFVQFNIDQLTDRRDCSLSFSGDFSLGDSSTWKSGGAGNDDPTYRLLIKSSAVGTTRTVTVSAASKTMTFTDIDLQDITIASTNSPTITGTRVGDCGGNTNVDADSPKTVYYDAGTTTACNFYDNYWSTSSGGGSPSLNNYPLPQDTAVIDNATWDDTGNTLTINDGLAVGNIDASALTEANTIVLGSARYYGDLILTGSGLTVTSTSKTITVDARVKLEATDTLDINRNGAIGSGAITIQSYGTDATVRLTSALTHTGAFTVTQGDFDLNGQILTTNIYSSSNSNTRELKDTAGGGKIIVNGLTGTIFDMETATGLTVSNAPDIDIGDGTKTLTGDVTFAGGGKTFGDMTVKKHAGNYSVIFTG